MMLEKYNIVFETLESMVYPLPSDFGYTRGDRFRFARTVRAKGPAHTGLSHWLVKRISERSANTVVFCGHTVEDGRLETEFEKAQVQHDALILKGGLEKVENDYLLSRYVSKYGLLKAVYVDSAGHFLRRRSIGKFFNQMGDYCDDDAIFYLLG